MYQFFESDDDRVVEMIGELRAVLADFAYTTDPVCRRLIEEVARVLDWFEQTSGLNDPPLVFEPGSTLGSY